MTEDENDFDYMGPTRRKRQATTSDATLDENPVTDSNETLYVTVYCNIDGAYPKPTNVQFHVGGKIEIIHSCGW